MGPQLPLQKRPKIENKRQAIKAETYSSSFAYSSLNKVGVQTHMAIILQELIKLHSIRECVNGSRGGRVSEKSGLLL